jgi:hypothetical protein
MKKRCFFLSFFAKSRTTYCGRTVVRSNTDGHVAVNGIIGITAIHGDPCSSIFTVK